LLKFKPPARRAYAPEGKAKTLTTPIRNPSGQASIHVVFRGLKFEPVDKSRSSGTQKLGKKRGFEKVS